MILYFTKDLVDDLNSWGSFLRISISLRNVLDTFNPTKVISFILDAFLNFLSRFLPSRNPLGLFENYLFIYLFLLNYT